jgi:hypothetical protein
MKGCIMSNFIEKTPQNKGAAKLFGIFFIITFLAYGVGTGIVESIIGKPDMLAQIFADKTNLVIGALLMSVVHTLMNIGLVVIMFCVIKPFNKSLSYGYLGAGLGATVLLAVGAIFLLLLVPLSEIHSASLDSGNAGFGSLAIVLSKGNFYAYQMGMSIWGMGGLMLSYVLFKSILVPRVISVALAIGYLVFITGTIAELFGYPIGVTLSIPGGLVEIILSIWLIIKGFDYSKTSAGQNFNTQPAS